jgi:hypothetical protein
MSKQYRSTRIDGETVPETVHQPEGPSPVPDALAALAGIHGLAAPSSGLAPTGTGLGGILSAYSMFAAGKDMAANGVDAMNVTEMGVGAAGLTSAVVSSTPVGQVAGSFSTGYAAGKTADAATAWVAPDNRGISDRIADRGTQAELDTDEVFGEDSTMGGIMGAATMFGEFARMGSFSEHIGNAASERIMHSASSWHDEEVGAVGIDAIVANAIAEAEADAEEEIKIRQVLQAQL